MEVDEIQGCEKHMKREMLPDIMMHVELLARNRAQATWMRVTAKLMSWWPNVNRVRADHDVENAIDCRLNAAAASVRREVFRLLRAAAAERT